MIKGQNGLFAGLPLHTAPVRGGQQRSSHEQGGPGADLPAWRVALVEVGKVSLYPVFKGSFPLMYAAAKRPVPPGQRWPADALVDMRDYPFQHWGEDGNRLPELSLADRRPVQIVIWTRIIEAGHFQP